MSSFQDMKVNEVAADDYACNMSSFKHSLYITHEWVSSVGSDRQVVYLHFEQNGEVVAKLSGLVLVGSKLVGKYLFFYAAPGLRYHTPEMFNKAMAALKRYAKRKGFAKIDMLNYDQQHDWVCNVKGYIRRGREEFIRFFEGPEAKLQFSKSLMYNVRKAQKANATFHHENSERVLAKLHELLAETQKLRFYKYGTDYSPYPYFLQTKESTDALFRSGLMKLYHIEIDGEIHCVRCALEKDKRMFGMMIASDSVSYKHGLQHFMQYCLIEEMHRNGYLYYNVSGTAPGEEGKGLSEYKESLGCMRAFVFGAYTHFLPFPKNILNPVMDFGRYVAKHPMLEKPIAGVSKILFKHQSV